MQRSLTRGSGKGDVRQHPDVTLEEVMALSAWMMDTCSMNVSASAAELLAVACECILMARQERGLYP